MDDGAAPVDEFDVGQAFERHRPALLGFAVNSLRDHALAEDCVQETFLRAWRGRATFDPRLGSERTWLFTIQRRVIIDTLRSSGRAPQRADGSDVGVEATVEPDPLARLELLHALDLLSEEHRAAVVAIHVDGRSYAEFAAELGVPVATLRTRTFYALRALRALLDDKDS